MRRENPGLGAVGMNIKTLQAEAQRQNLLTYDMYLNRLIELGVSMFVWENIPPTVDVRFLELTLLSKGSAVFFMDEVLGYLALSVAYNGPLNVYNIPIRRRAYATNGYNMPLHYDNSVIIYNNNLRNDTYFTIAQYAYRLAQIERAIDVNIRGQKTPVMIKCAESQRLVMQNLYMKYDGNIPFIFGDKNLDLEGVSVLNTNVPFIADNLQIIKRQMWSEALNFLGIESANSDKKERLVSGEIDATLGGVEAQRYTRLNAREQACEEINRMFGLDVSVRFKSDHMFSTGDDVGTPESEIQGNEVLEDE